MLSTNPPATAGGTDSGTRTIRDFEGKPQLTSVSIIKRSGSAL